MNRLTLAALALVALASNAHARRIIDCDERGCRETVAAHHPQDAFAVQMHGRPVWQPLSGRIRAVRRQSGSLAGVHPTLATKAASIAQACGARVISGVRHTYVAGTRRVSLHASGHAVDMVGNPSCIYAQLAGWPGGYSTDYSRVSHVHISYGGREHGLRFAHGGGRHRHAARGHHRYRMARR